MEKGLKEPSQEYRELCIQLASAYEIEAENWLIESATDSKDIGIRYEAFRLLIKQGVRNLQAILCGLSDQSEQIRALCRQFLESKYNGDHFSKYYSQPSLNSKLTSIMQISKGMLGGMSQGVELAIEDIIHRGEEIQQSRI